jgi:hypothetical protein
MRASVAIPVRYRRTLLLRGVVVWAFARIMVMVLYLLVMASLDREVAALFIEGNPLVQMAWTLALTATLIRLDLNRRREEFLLNNLGVPTRHAVMLGTMPAVLVETALVAL